MSIRSVSRTSHAVADGLLARYLDELSLDREPPSYEALVRLHRAHATRFAHSTLWKVRGRLPAMTTEGLLLALLDGEGGGCLHLNGSFAWLLRTLGYDVGLHGGRVQRAFVVEADLRRDVHPVVVVHLEGGPWYADVGMGNGLLEPIPLVAGSFPQPGGFRYALERCTEPGLAWRFVHDRSMMGLRQVEIEDRARPLEAMTATYLHDATDPASVSLRQVMANRRHPHGVVSLTGGTLIRRGDEGRSLRHLESAQEWEAVLREEFLLGLPDWSTEERDRLWAWAIRTG